MSAAYAATKPAAGRLCLGTAQFGQHYGIANQSGKVSKEEASRILSLAQERGVDSIDTAMDYGDSEHVLGQVGVSRFNVVTKLPALPDDVADVQAWVNAMVGASLNRLGAPFLYGLLLHRPGQLSGKQGAALSIALQNVKATGLVRKIGVSIYDPEELESILDALPVDLIQAPFNLIDRRLHTSGWLDRLHDKGVEIHVRSVFLQGLLLMPPTAVPGKFRKRWPKVWDTWYGWLSANPAVSAVQACIGFVHGFSQINRIVIGVDSPIQLSQIIGGLKIGSPKNWPAMGHYDRLLISPYLWPDF